MIKDQTGRNALYRWRKDCTNLFAKVGGCQSGGGIGNGNAPNQTSHRRRSSYTREILGTTMLMSRGQANRDSYQKVVGGRRRSDQNRLPMLRHHPCVPPRLTARPVPDHTAE